jgi:hypothetical protein
MSRKIAAIALAATALTLSVATTTSASTQPTTQIVASGCCRG